MSLDAVKQIQYHENDLAGTLSCDRTAAFEKWRDFPASRISHHGAMCCEIAREWLLSMDFSQLNGGSRLTGPRWIRERYDWGPTQWQIHWCEAVERPSLDCGAQAAFANEVFRARGVQSYPAQLVQQFSAEATAQWAHKWNGEETSLHWLNDDVIYHEGCAVVSGENNEIKIWDASAAWWVNPRQAGGYGSLLAVRIVGAPNEAGEFKWGGHKIRANEWQEIVETV